MMGEFLLVLVKSSLPIGATSFALVWWALRQGYLGDAESMYQYEQQKKAADKLKKKEKKQRKLQKKLNKKQGLPKGQATDSVSPAAEELKKAKNFDPLHSKWMQFGGGFYGVVAFFTYLLIELAEVRDFLANFADLFRGGLINMVVHFFIESIRNFVAAIAWPAYWLRRISGDPWMWILGAYGGYWLGSKLAFQLRSRSAG